VVRSVRDQGRTEPFIFAECPSYPAAMEVAALGGDQVFTEGQMLDHRERRRALTAWDKGDGPHPSLLSTRSHLQATSDSFSMEAPNG